MNQLLDILINRTNNDKIVLNYLLKYLEHIEALFVKQNVCNIEFDDLSQTDHLPTTSNTRVSLVLSSLKCASKWLPFCRDDFNFF